MGKKTRKTRWRTLAIADESDSEESNTLSGSQLSKSYHHRPFYSKFTHSSQSTPTRRFPYEPKSTRSSSTASETKITFNEDEYTKITTPRQDVLFKKGYLSKPKNYQTQTSTGNSTASTGNSTGNGTPDHQSADGTEGTDLEYESQFVFPNAFVDQNGIYYINSYEHYPMVLYNPPICYPEYPTSRTKRHSTGSLTESTSPHTEDTSQDLSQSGGENTGNGPEFNHVYNIIYPGYYFNGLCNSNVTTNGQAATEPRKIKKKRRRKISKSINQEDTTSSEDGYSSDEAITQVENRIQCTAPHNPDTKTCPKLDGHSIAKNIGNETNVILVDECEKLEDTTIEKSDGNYENQSSVLSSQTEYNFSSKRIESESDSISSENHLAQKEISEKSIDENNKEHTREISHEDEVETTKDEKEHDEGLDTNTKSHESSHESISKSEDVPEVIQQDTSDNATQPIHESKFNLNAQEFVPRAYRNVEAVSVDPNLQFINIHPNFVPLPLINHHLNELNHPHPPHFNQPFLPPGIPLNFVTADTKLLPNFVNLLPNNFVPPKPYEQSTSSTPSKIKDSVESDEQLETKTDEIKSTEAVEAKKEMEKQDISDEKPSDVENPKPVIYKNNVDIAKIVSKLEEAAKEQKLYENRRQEYRSPNKFNKFKPKYNSSYQSQDASRSNVDKRRFRRFDHKASENTESKLKQTTATLTEESLNSPDRFLKKSETEAESQIKTETRDVTAKPNGDEIKYSPRHPFKNQESPRRYTNYNRNIKNKSPDRNYTTPTNDYSNTLKKSYNKSYSKYDKYTSEKINMATKQTPKKKIEESIKDVKTKPLTAPNQWISVSNRKKRKNKSTNDDDIENAKDVAIEVDSEVFEISNDSKPQEIQLEDIIIAETLIESDRKDSSIKIDTFIEMVSKSESTPIKICSKTEGAISEIVLQDVKDIELELLKESVKIIEAAEDESVISIPKIEEIGDSLPRVQTKTQKETSKKKRKGVGKNSTKRIIILDPDVSKKEPQEKDIPKAKLNTEKPLSEEEEDEAVKPTEDLSVDKVADISSIQKEDGSNNNELTTMEKSTDTIQTPDKKKNKKKKKQVKPSLITGISSVSSSSTTLNNVDDSYDFLLDTTALVEEKTNVEVSEELDKMIQRGLFGNLEEKFKSLNVSVDDDFFKSLTLASKPQPTPEKGFIKATNFTTILNHANQPAPKVTINDEQDKIDIDFSKIKLPDCEPQPSTSKMGIFLEKPPPNETGPPEETEAKLSSKSNGKLKNKSKKRLADIDLEAEIRNKIVSQDEAKYFTNNDPENDNMTSRRTADGGESILTDFFQEDVENKTNLEDGTVKAIDENVTTTSDEDTIAQNEISVIDTSNDDICRNSHPKLRTEIPPTELLNGYRSDDALDIEVMVRKEIENDTLEEDVDQAKNLQEKRIVIKIEKAESLEDLSLESTLTKTEDYLTDGEYPKSFSDTSNNMKPLYPITQAVREWMTKTRETTPEIEILKSPDTIYKEFIEYSEGEESASDKETDQKNGKSNPAFVEYLDQNEICHISMNARVANSNSDNDTTVCETWSMSQDTSIQDEDLLDCWEPDIVETKKEDVSRKNEPIEEAEDVLEVYESKYGKNEDFLRLKAEIEEHKKNGTFPKHSNLPYRAICCSLM